jgi:hypothetical protein
MQHLLDWKRIRPSSTVTVCHGGLALGDNAVWAADQMTADRPVACLGRYRGPY